MRATLNPAHLLAFFLCAVLLAGNLPQGGASFAQDKPNRPPWAQKSKSASAEKSQPGETDNSQDSTAQRGRIRVNVNLVNVLVSVLDEHNRPAPDLPRESFQLFEEGVEQKIDVFESETQLPLDLALMIDSSLSAHKEIAFEQDAAAHFISQVLRPGDRLAVFSVGENVTQLAGFSDNVATLQAAVHRMPSDAGTSIYDAILLASRSLEHRGEDRRRVIILVTDAGETTSTSDFDAARKAAVRSGSLLYTIVIRPVKNESGHHGRRDVLSRRRQRTRRHLRPHQSRAAHPVPPRLLPQSPRPRQHLSPNRSQSLRQIPGPPPQVLPHRSPITERAAQVT